jgi:hypothetical protein
MEGTITGCGREIKWTMYNSKQASSGASECFQQNGRRKGRPTWKMIGKNQRRVAEVGEGRIMW